MLKSRTIKLASLLLAIFLALNCFYFCVKSRFDSNTNVDLDSFMAFEEQKFKPVEEALSSYEVVGYVDDSFIDPWHFNDRELAEFFASQYFLAPVFIDGNKDHEIILGNFHQRARQENPARWEVFQDFGNGVVLFKNKDYKPRP